MIQQYVGHRLVILVILLHGFEVPAAVDQFLGMGLNSWSKNCSVGTAKGVL